MNSLESIQFTKFENRVYYSVFTPKYIKEILLDNYELPGSVAVNLYYTGINLLYLVKTIDEKYVFRISMTTVPLYGDKIPILEQMKFEGAALNLLRDRGIGVNYPLKMKNGEYFGEMDSPEGKRPFVLLSFVDGYGKTFLTKEEGNNMGRILAKMHVALDKLETPHRRFEIGVDEYIERPILGFEKNLAKKYPEKFIILKKAGEIVRKKLERYPKDKKLWGLIHGDIHTYNCHFPKQKEVIIIDFDFMCYSWRLFDLVGIFGMHDFIGRPEDREKEELKRHAILQGYDEILPLSDLEKEFIPVFKLLRLFWTLEIQVNHFNKLFGELNEFFLNKLFERFEMVVNNPNFFVDTQEEYIKS